MTAFLFIPTQPDAQRVHRVDFANIANLFVEIDEPDPRGPGLQGRTIRLAAFAVIVLALVGDTVLVARPSLLTHTFASQALPGHATS